MNQWKIFVSHLHGTWPNEASFIQFSCPIICHVPLPGGMDKRERQKLKAQKVKEKRNAKTGWQAGSVLGWDDKHLRSLKCLAAMFRKSTFPRWNVDWFWQESPNTIYCCLCKSRHLSLRWVTGPLNFMQFPFEVGHFGHFGHQRPSDLPRSINKALRTAKTTPLRAVLRHGSDPSPALSFCRFLECAGKGEKGKERKEGEEREEGLWCQILNVVLWSDCSYDYASQSMVAMQGSHASSKCMHFCIKKPTMQGGGCARPQDPSIPFGNEFGLTDTSTETCSLQPLGSPTNIISSPV